MAKMLSGLIGLLTFNVYFNVLFCLFSEIYVAKMLSDLIGPLLLTVYLTIVYSVTNLINIRCLLYRLFCRYTNSNDITLVVVPGIVNIPINQH